MYFIQLINFLIFILLNYTLLVFALPAASALNLTVTSNDSSTALKAANFHRDIALGIATAERTWRQPALRLYLLRANTINGPQRMPLPLIEATLSFLLEWPFVVEIHNNFLGSAWLPPIQKKEGLSFGLATFNWDQIPMSIEEAQQRVVAARNVPDEMRVFDSVAIYVHDHHHPRVPILPGDLTFGFFLEDQTAYWAIFVVATTGVVYVDDYRDDARNAVQVT